MISFEHKGDIKTICSVIDIIHMKFQIKPVRRLNLIRQFKIVNFAGKHKVRDRQDV